MGKGCECESVRLTEKHGWGLVFPNTGQYWNYLGIVHLPWLSMTNLRQNPLLLVSNSPTVRAASTFHILSLTSPHWQLYYTYRVAKKSGNITEFLLAVCWYCISWQDKITISISRLHGHLVHFPSTQLSHTAYCLHYNHHLVLIVQININLIFTTSENSDVSLVIQEQNSLFSVFLRKGDQ